MTVNAELERNAAGGDKSAQITLARLHESEGRHDLARGWYARAAKLGNISALRSLAINLLTRNPIMALDGTGMIRAAADQDDADAQHICAVIAAQDSDLPDNWNIAMEYLRRSAKGGSTLAQRQLQLLGDAEPAPAEPTGPAVRMVMDRWLTPAPSSSVFEAPRIRSCRRFATPEECDWLIWRARPELKRAQVYDPNGLGGVRAESVRNNSDMNFDIANSDLVVMALRERIKKLAGLTTEVLEPTMVLHYTPAQRFAPHYDYIEPTSPHLQRDIAENGQRVATFLLYLNDDYEGGETDFPRLDWRFKGSKGDALVFWNVDIDGGSDPRTLHAGLAPLTGEKWLLSQWIRQRN